MVRSPAPPWLAPSLVLGALLARGAPGLPQEPPPAGGPQGDSGDPGATDPLATLAQGLVVHRLGNGWTFLLLPTPGPPAVHCATRLPVGSADDAPGSSGLAALAARLSGQGSERFGALDRAAEVGVRARADRAWDQVLQARAGGGGGGGGGGQGRPAVELAPLVEAWRREVRTLEELAPADPLGAFLEQHGGRVAPPRVGRSTTRFGASLPASQLGRWCWLAAERLGRPTTRGLHRERAALVATLAARGDDPLIRLRDLLRTLALPSLQPPGGIPSELEALGRQGVQAFLRDHYGPRGVVTAVVGAFDPGLVLPVLERHAGALGAPAPAPPPTPLAPAGPPAPQGPRHLETVHPGPALVGLAWPAPPARDPDRLAFEAGLGILEGRWRVGLVRGSLASALEVGIGLASEPDCPLVFLVVAPLPGVDPVRVEAALVAEVARLAREGPIPGELAAVARRERLALLADLEDPAALARRLLDAHGASGDARRALDRPRRLGALPPGDLGPVLGRWLDPRGRSTVILRPGTVRPAGDGGGGGEDR